MGANVKPASIQKAGKALAPVYNICQRFELQTSRSIQSHHHPVPKFGKDFETVVKLLDEEKVFVPMTGRQHDSFRFNSGLMEKLPREEVLKKVETNIKQLYQL